MRYGSIYLIKNKVNGKKYVGQTIFSVDVRWKSHISSDKSVVSKAIKKYGLENFEFIELCSAKTEIDLNELESYFIKLYDSAGLNGYNLTLGGDASCGKFTKEVRLKMRMAKLGKKRKDIHANQSGSSKEIFEHAQRLEGETENVNNPSTSSRQPCVSKYELNKEEIISLYNENKSSYFIAKKLNLDKSHICRYLKKWEVLKSQSKAASIRNTTRYEISEFLKNKILERYRETKNISRVSRELGISRKTVYRVLG